MTWRPSAASSVISGHEARAERDRRHARRAAWLRLSRRPTAWPTRTVAAIETPNGTMNMIEAVVMAI